MDRLLKEALNEALQVKARAGFRMVPSLFTTVKSSAEDIIAAFSKGTVLHGEMDALENAGRHPAVVYRECSLIV